MQIGLVSCTVILSGDSLIDRTAEVNNAVCLSAMVGDLNTSLRVLFCDVRKHKAIFKGDAGRNLFRDSRVGKLLPSAACPRSSAGLPPCSHTSSAHWPKVRPFSFAPANMKPKLWEVRVGWSLWEGLSSDFTEALCEENATWNACMCTYIYTYILFSYQKIHSTSLLFRNRVEMCHFYDK